MDDVASYNRERWNDLVRAGVQFSRSWDHMDEEELRQRVDPYGILGDPTGKDVLCLAGAGGQQGPAFARLGARVTVLDLSDEMLARDHQAAARSNLDIRIEQGDMRDLSRFDDASFDIVWHAFSLNFIPDPHPAFREAARVLRPGGFYRISFHNPFVIGLDETEWDSIGYPIHLPYVQGAEMPDVPWDVWPEGQSSPVKVRGPREFRHTLSTILNSLTAQGLRFIALHEERTDTPGGIPADDLAPGTWEHFMSITAPWFNVWMVKHK